MTVRFTADSGVGVITIDRPERRNAIDRPTAQGIADALTELDEREDITVGIITGAGGTFSAGMDLKALTETGERPIIEGRGAFGIVERPPDKPVEVAANAPLAVRISKQVVRAAQGATFAEAYERQQPLMAQVRASNDAKEGATAFVEKRAPVWTGT